MMKRSRWIAAAGALIVMLTGCGVNEGTPTLPSEPATTVESRVETTAPTEASATPETEADVEHCGLHTLRHTFASKLFAATNGNAKLVSELVRHSSVSFTEDIYIHLIEQTKANVLEDFSI